MERQQNKRSRTGAKAMQIPDMKEDEAIAVETEKARKVIKNEPELIKAELDAGSLMAIACGYEEYWPWYNGSVVDEQMSWGSLWHPLWDLNSLGQAYDALYSDVVWEEDIWNLKAIKEVPKHDQKSQV